MSVEEITLPSLTTMQDSENHLPEVHGCLLVDRYISVFTISFN